MSDNIINLEKYRAEKAKVFTGRDRGKDIRERSGIDTMVNDERVQVIIPEEIYSINPSFFEELFVNVVTLLGKELFYQKFKFEALGGYNYSKPLEEAIDRILRHHTALD